MKILMTTDTIGGVWTYSLELCKSLRNYGIQVHLAAMGNWPSDEQQQEVAALKNVILYKSGFKLEWMQDPWEDIQKAQKWINCIYQTIQPDMVHLNNFAQIDKNWTSPVVTVFHSCVQTWWQSVKNEPAPAEWNNYKNLVEDSLNASGTIIAPTKAILEKAKKKYAFPSETKIIYNGRSMKLFTGIKKEKIIFCMGRIWDEAKNLSLLTEIAAELPWPIYIAGDNSELPIKENIVPKNIHFLGKLSPDDIVHWLQKASIFVSPTKYEPFGLAILEAAKTNCALALNKIDTLEEVWGDAAFYFDAGNKNEAQKALLQLIEDETLLAEYQEKALKKSQEYSTEKMGLSYRNLYERLIVTNQKTIQI